MYTTTSEGETPSEKPGGTSGHYSGRAASPPPFTPELLEHLRARIISPYVRTEPLATSADGTVAIYRTSFDIELLRALLEFHLGLGGFTESYEVVETGGFCTALCRLRIGPVERTGAGRAANPDRALQEALVNAALAFGIGTNVPALGNVALRETPEGWKRLDGGADPEAITLLRRNYRF